MTGVTVYAAASLDGFIARKDGGIDWLPPLSADEDYGYHAFIASVDALVMGRRTYDQAMTFGGWPYAGKPCWVVSHTRAGEENTHAQFVDAPPDISGHVWLVGGAEIIRAYAEASRINNWIVTIVPILLGQGIPLFPPTPRDEPLSLLACKSYPNSMVQLHYREGDERGHH